MSSLQPPAATSADKVAEESELKNEKLKIQARKHVVDYMPTERRSPISYKAPSSGKKKPKPVEPDNQGSLLEYISTPVKYFTSVFSSPQIELPKSPPKPKFKYPEKERIRTAERKPKSPKPVEQPSQTQPTPPPPPTEMPAEVVNNEQLENNLETMAIAAAKEKKTGDSKKDDPKRSTSLLIKSNSKPNPPAPSNKTSPGDKKTYTAATIRMPSASPRILSASSIKVASSSNNLSYRVTSTDKEYLASKVKKPLKKVFKDYANKSPNNSIKRSSSPVSTDKREEPPFNYVPLNSVEFYRN